MTTIEIPAIANAAAQEALKSAAWEIAKDAANSEAIGKAYAPLAPSAEDRAASRDQINALMNAAAALQGIAARDWAEGMIRECAAEAE